MREKKVTHVAGYSLPDGRPPCGTVGDVIQALSFEFVTCATCQRLLMEAMLDGRLPDSFHYWRGLWQPYYMSDEEAEAFYRSLRALGLSAPGDGQKAVVAPQTLRPIHSERGSA